MVNCLHLLYQDGLSSEFLSNNERSKMTDDPNIIELRASSSPWNYGNMLRLASELELLKDAELEKHKDLWTYLRTRDFDSLFIEGVAKTYWARACRIVHATPYYQYITPPGLYAERRLVGHLLREVCHLMTEESKQD